MPTSPNVLPAAASSRRHDLDWLRVIAFALLILYHVGMFYVTWDWHLKSRHASPFAEPAMALLNPWRLALLFFISGVATRFALDKTGAGGFALARIGRLLVPLVFGMAVVAMPQAYLELLAKGEIQPGIMAFWSTYLGLPPGPYSIITPTWNHLWYVAYVLVYSLLAALLRPALAAAEPPFQRVGRWLAETRYGLRMLLFPVLPFLFYRFALEPRFPTTHALVDDWATHANYLTIFLIGWFAAKSAGFWTAVERSWKPALGLAIVLGVLIVAAKLNLEEVRSSVELRTGLRAGMTVYAWSVIVALLGLARRLLNRSGPILAYLTEAVFPWYILHQTLIVTIGWTLLDARLSAPAEFLLVVGGTVAGCAVGYEAIRRIPPLRPLFGLSVRRRRKTAAQSVPTLDRA